MRPVLPILVNQLVNMWAARRRQRKVARHDDADVHLQSLELAFGNAVPRNHDVVVAQLLDLHSGGPQLVREERSSDEHLVPSYPSSCETPFGPV